MSGQPATVTAETLATQVEANRKGAAEDHSMLSQSVIQLRQDNAEASDHILVRYTSDLWSCNSVFYCAICIIDVVSLAVCLCIVGAIVCCVLYLSMVCLLFGCVPMHC